MVAMDSAFGTLLIGSWIDSCLFTIEVTLLVKYFRGTRRQNDGYHPALVSLAGLNDVIGVASTMIMVYEYLGGAIWTAYMTQAYNTFVERDKPKMALTVWLVVSAAADVLLAAALVGRLLFVRRSTAQLAESASTSMLERLIRNALETGSITAVVALGSFITYKVWPDTNVDLGIVYLLGRIYTITMVANLLARKSINRDNLTPTTAGRKTKGVSEGVNVVKNTTVHYDRDQEMFPISLEPSTRFAGVVEERDLKEEDI
ncbi:hypothetical protein MNV49_001737 [Pseudohyphozyma bogoriensis]|nr:hypothetical protein MNV49_001737 [Pseudohyphozyma bogoriensis]